MPDPLFRWDRQRFRRRHRRHLGPLNFSLVVLPSVDSGVDTCSSALKCRDDNKRRNDGGLLLLGGSPEEHKIYRVPSRDLNDRDSNSPVPETYRKSFQK